MQCKNRDIKHLQYRIKISHISTRNGKFHQKYSPKENKNLTQLCTLTGLFDN
jgi:hypothetical protein